MLTYAWEKNKIDEIGLFFCVVKYVNLVNHIMAKIFTVDTIVNKKMSPVYFDKNLYMKETNNHAMFFKRKHTTPYYKLYVIIYVMNIQEVINDHLWYRHTAEM